MAHVLPSGGGKALMNTDDTALLLLDHQTGLFQTVKDITVAELRANVMALVRIGVLLKLPGRGSLFLRRSGLAPPTPRRSPGAPV